MELNWKRTAAVSSAVAAVVCLLYYIFKVDNEEENDEFDSYKQNFGKSSKFSSSKVDNMSRKECLDLLAKLSKSQDDMKKFMATLVKDLMDGKISAKLSDVYERALPDLPEDPLEAMGLTLFDLDHLVERYQHDQSIRESILNIMNVTPSATENDDELLNITTDDLIKIHEFMLKELVKLVSEYKKIPKHDSMDKKALTVALQALISAEVQKKFGYTHTAIDKAVINNHTELSMSTKFTRITMRMQSEMSEITG